MTGWTVAIRDKVARNRRYLYVSGDDLSVSASNRRNAKRLTREQAEMVKRLLIEKCAAVGRPVDCLIVTVPGVERSA